MLAVVDPVTLLCAMSFVVFGVYSVALWVYGFIRTGLVAFGILIVAAVIGIAVSIANVALVYDSYIGIRLLGRTGWRIFYYAFVCIQPLESLLSAVALTMLVIWITRRGLTNR
jgi:hypothetical protein